MLLLNTIENIRLPLQLCFKDNDICSKKTRIRLGLKLVKIAITSTFFYNFLLKKMLIEPENYTIILPFFDLVLRFLLLSFFRCSDSPLCLRWWIRKDILDVKVLLQYLH